MNFFRRLFLSIFYLVGVAAPVAAFGPDGDFGNLEISENVGLSNAEIGSAPFRPGLMRIDFSLTAAEPANWDGEIRLSRGSFANLVPLGVDPTCATTFFFADSAQTQIGLRTVAPLTFCGFEATIFSPRDARLEIRLRDRTTGRTFEKTVFVERLIDSSTKIPLDAAGNGVFIVRAPADEIPIRVEKIISGGSRPVETTVFKPGETVRVSVLPRSSATREIGDSTLTATATTRDGTAFWSESRSLSLVEIREIDALVGDPGSVPTAQVFEFVAPQTEGVFELSLELIPKKKGAKPTFALPQTKRPDRPIARRVVQGVVAPAASKRADFADSVETSGGDWRGELLETIDPTNPNWRKTFSKRSVFQNLFKTSDADGDKLSAKSKATPTFATDDATILGQNAAAPFGKNPFGFIAPQISYSQNAELVETRRRELARRWRVDQFRTFYPAIDRRDWGLTADLWAKPLSGGNSTVLDASETARLAAAPTGFVRLDPNGTSRRVADSPNKNKIASVAWLAPAGDAAKTLGKTEEKPSTTAASNGATETDAKSTAKRVSWEAYPIPIREPGKAHLLEIEYPTNLPQRLGIAVLEPSPTGGLFQTTLDVGLVAGDGALDDRDERGVSRYSVLFWPKTKAPTILLTNRSSETPAIFGQIRVYRADLERRPVAPRSDRGRVFGAALTKPTICDQFSAVRKPSPFGVLGSDDWTTFDDATTRAFQYLAASNFDSAILAVAADGTALYPSSRLAPTPRCDGGVFLPTGGDPIRKDALELALAKFDAGGATLIPLLDLNAPLPELEAELRKIHSDSVANEERAKGEGIEWIGPDGRLLIESRQAADGTGPYYNVLHPSVQRAVFGVVQELAARCGARESFGGVALDVGAGGWLALPDDVYFGMDDETIGRFVEESNLAASLQRKGGRGARELLFAQGPERYRVRAEFIRDVCLEEWLNWRCDALYRFYREVRAVVASSRPGARLYLVATDALDGPVCRSLLYPSFRNASKLRDALRLVGLDPTRFDAGVGLGTRASVDATKTANFVGFGTSVRPVNFVDGGSSSGVSDPAITLLRPEIVASTSSLARSARELELTKPDAISLFAARQAAPGAFFYHRAEKLPLPEFDAASPYRPTFVELETRALPADFENRRRFARQLANADALFLFDGGDLAPSGQEETLRDWADAFRRLPAVPFQTWTPKLSDGGAGAVKNDGKTAQAEKTSGFEKAPVDASTADERSIQPLVVRYYRNEKETWVYLLNAASFHLGVKLSMRIRPGATFETFAGSRPDRPLSAADEFVWTYSSTPFELVAVRLDDPKATVATVEVSRPDEICGVDGRLSSEIQNFVDRVLAASSGVPFALRNGDFEESFARRDVETAIDSDVGSDSFGLELPKMKLFKRSDEPLQNAALNSGDPAPSAINPNEIPGWRAFGPEDVVVRLDEKVVRSGRAALLLASARNAGGVLGEPFVPPPTGRICVQICFGVPTDAQELPLRVCLTGRRADGEPYLRRLVVGPTILDRARRQVAAANSENATGAGTEAPNASGVVWVRDVVLFDRLPLDGLESASLRFDLSGPGKVWLDDVRVYKLAFADAEQNDLMRVISAAEFRVSKDRVLDSLNLLDGYWARLLKEQIPDDSPLLTERRRPRAVASAPQDAPPAEEKDAKKSKNGFVNALEKLKFW